MMEQFAQKYDYILWDVDGTLLDFLASEKFAMHDCFRHFHYILTDEMLSVYSQINQDCWRKLERGEVEKAWGLKNRFHIVFEIYQSIIDVNKFAQSFTEKEDSVFYFLDFCGGL